MNQHPKKLWKVQRQLADYSLPVYQALSQKTDFLLFYTPGGRQSGFNAARHADQHAFSSIQVPAGRFGFFDPLLGIRFGQKAIKLRPDKVILTGDTRYTSFWMILIFGRILGIEIYIHGHALCKKLDFSALDKLINRFLYWIVLQLCTGYIAYTDKVKESFVTFGLDDRKVTVAENSLCNAHPVDPADKDPSQNGIFFCGRIRENHGLDLLIRVAEQLRNETNLDIELHIIGDGKEAESIRERAVDRPWITLYGKVYDEERIREISLKCSIGCYPGTAGLSVVHYMSLSLAPVTHDHMTSHGPEVSYIEDSVNGHLYDHTHPEHALRDCLSGLLTQPEKLTRMQHAAYETYEHLINPPLEERLLRAVGW